MYVAAGLNIEQTLSRWVWMMPAANRKKLSEYGAIELESTPHCFRAWLRTCAGSYPTASHPTTLYVDPGNKIYSLALTKLCFGGPTDEYLSALNVEHRGDALEAALGANYVACRKHGLVQVTNSRGEVCSTSHLITLRKRIEEACAQAMLDEW